MDIVKIAILVYFQHCNYIVAKVYCSKKTKIASNTSKMLFLGFSSGRHVCIPI